MPRDTEPRWSGAGKAAARGNPARDQFGQDGICGAGAQCGAAPEMKRYGPTAAPFHVLPPLSGGGRRQKTIDGDGVFSVFFLFTALVC